MRDLQSGTSNSAWKSLFAVSGVLASLVGNFAPLTAARRQGKQVHAGGRPARRRRNRRPRTAAGKAMLVGASREDGKACLGLQGTRRRTLHLPGVAMSYDAARTALDRTRAWEKKKGTHTEVLPLRQDRGRAPGPPGKVGTRPGCRVLPPAAGRSRRSGARRELTRARSGDCQARVVVEPIQNHFFSMTSIGSGSR